jgi:glyoxylate/hydroxypyruvate/2-ketogluconate reductase
LGLAEQEAAPGPSAARMLKGKTIGIIGFGNIARALTVRLAGWGVKILVTSRGDAAGIGQCDLDTLLRESDIVVPLVPLTEETRVMLSRDRLLLMKKGAILVNLSRGAVVDEQALTDPEIVDHLGGIALDVFEIEPLPAKSPLRQHPKAILTNHDIAHTYENLQALLDTAVKNVLAAIAGLPMLTSL